MLSYSYINTIHLTNAVFHGLLNVIIICNENVGILRWRAISWAIQFAKIPEWA